MSDEQLGELNFEEPNIINPDEPEYGPGNPLFLYSYTEQRVPTDFVDILYALPEKLARDVRNVGMFDIVDSVHQAGYRILGDEISSDPESFRSYLASTRLGRVDDILSLLSNYVLFDIDFHSLFPCFSQGVATMVDSPNIDDPWGSRWINQVSGFFDSFSMSELTRYWWLNSGVRDMEYVRSRTQIERGFYRRAIALNIGEFNFLAGAHSLDGLPSIDFRWMLDITKPDNVIRLATYYDAGPYVRHKPTLAHFVHIYPQGYLISHAFANVSPEQFSELIRSGEFL